METASRYTILLNEERDFNLCSLARSIAKLLKRQVSDVSKALRYSRGIIFDDLNQQEAKLVLEFFNGQGISTLSIPTCDVVLLPKPKHINYGAIHENGLCLGSNAYDKTQIQIQWGRFFLLCFGSIQKKEYDLKKIIEDDDFQTMIKFKDQEDLKKIFKNKVCKNIYNQSPNISEEENREDYFAFITKEPWEYYRFSRHNFCYNPIKEKGDLSSLPNFYKWVEDVVKYTDTCFFPKSTRDFIENKGKITMSFESINDFERYTLWAFQIAFQKDRQENDKENKT